MYKSVCRYIFIPFGEIPTSEIAVLFFFLSDCTTWLVGSYFPNQGSLGSKSWVLTIGCQGIPIAHIFLFSFVFVLHLKQLADFFPRVAPSFYSRISSVSAFQFLSILTDAWCVVSAFSCSHSDRCVSVYDNGFNLLFLMTNDFEHLQGLIGLVCVLYSVCSVLLIFNCIVFLLLTWRQSLYILDASPFRNIYCEYFVTVCILPSRFLRCLLKRILVRCIYIHAHICIYTLIWYIKHSNDWMWAVGLKSLVQFPTLL